ncbi:hypothetical protein ACFW34_11860 [Streptomyces sp. NPDC058848]|uniref:hypothetical protein n=1 Tax=unclassified Streptomyces TaxID=2593676 RepID=UPI00367B224E
MDFRTALDTVTAELTPQPWEYTTPDGVTLTVIPAGLRAEAGMAEVYVRITASKTVAAEYPVTTTDLPALIGALGRPVTAEWTLVPRWPDGHRRYFTDGGLSLAPADGGLTVIVTDEDELSAAVRLPERERMPLVSALRRALDVAQGWEDDAR